MTQREVGDIAAMLDQDPQDFVAKFCRVRPTALASASPCSAWSDYANNMQAPAGDSDGSRHKLKMNPRTEACIFLVEKKCSIYQHRPLQVGRLAVWYESMLFVTMLFCLLSSCLLFLSRLLCTLLR